MKIIIAIPPLEGLQCARHCAKRLPGIQSLKAANVRGKDYPRLVDEEAEPGVMHTEEAFHRWWPIPSSRHRHRHDCDVILNNGHRDLSECPVHSRCSGVFIESLYTDLGRKWGEWAG